jgi:hypothetical protein
MLYALNEIREKKLALRVLFVGNDLTDDRDITQKEQEHRMISSFRHEEDENCALLGDYQCSLHNIPEGRSSQQNRNI